MGNSESSQKGQVLSKEGQPQQPTEPPYPGPSAQYQFLNVQVTMSTQISFSSIGTQIVTSNVEAYYPTLAQPYEQGYRLLSFYHIPEQVQRTGGLFSRDVLMPFQGIFCRYPQAPSNERFQLRIEKSVIQPQAVFNGFITSQTNVVTDTSHLFQTIANNVENGGRLICIELTGQEVTDRAHFGVPRMPVMGCDLFFEVPLDGAHEKYVYNVGCVPIQVEIAGFPPRPRVYCDWLGVLAQYLGQGYKLVEIFMDQTSNKQYSGFSTKTASNSQWFFEKPASRINDPTPVYQGTVLEHEIHMSHGIGGTVTSANWEPVIQEMGNKGWELACILEINESRVAVFAGATMKVMLFFQRRILLPRPTEYLQ